MRRWIALTALVLLSACATAQPKTFAGTFQHPPPHSRVLLMTPDVQLALLTAAGLPQPREDWSRSGRDNMAASLASAVRDLGHNPSALDPTTAMDGRIGQIIRLHDAVGTSILAINYGAADVPTRKHDFSWTLGDGVQELGTAYSADYALFITARGSYASSGRVAAMVGLAILGVGVPLGGQQAFASLVDLHTGNVIWFNVVVASPDEDMRDPARANQLAERLLHGSPL